jgi:glycosyltransferase involved in cell wall biosynthesis
VVGDAAVFVNGQDPAAIAAAVDALLDDAALRGDLSERARRRAESLFSYERRRRDIESIIDGLL